jgi:hypothetical protein
MGVKDIDRSSISIVLENMGEVYFDSLTEKWVNWIMEECDETLVFEKNWKGCRYWELYNEDQFNSTVKLCKHLCTKFDIDLDSLGFNVHHDKTKNYNGIVCRSNYDTDYSDLNPSFDFKRFLKDLGVKYD